MAERVEEEAQGELVGEYELAKEELLGYLDHGRWSRVTDRPLVDVFHLQYLLVRAGYTDLAVGQNWYGSLDYVDGRGKVIRSFSRWTLGRLGGLQRAYEERGEERRAYCLQKIAVEAEQTIRFELVEGNRYGWRNEEGEWVSCGAGWYAASSLRQLVEENEPDLAEGEDVVRKAILAQFRKLEEVKEELKGVGKRWLALGRIWHLGHDGNVYFHLNPEGRRYKAGRYTVEDLRQWVDDEGPVVKGLGADG